MIYFRNGKSYQRSAGGKTTTRLLVQFKSFEEKNVQKCVSYTASVPEVTFFFEDNFALPESEKDGKK